jgi:hypothetical protein
MLEMIIENPLSASVINLRPQAGGVFSKDKGPEQPIPVLERWLLHLSLVHDELVTEYKDPQPRRPIEPSEDEQIETLYDRDQEQDLHGGRMESRAPESPTKSIGTRFSRSTGHAQARSGQTGPEMSPSAP